MLSEMSIEKYRVIFRQQFGVELTRDEAIDQANRLLNLARIVHQPMPKAWEGRYDELLRQRNVNEDEDEKRDHELPT